MTTYDLIVIGAGAYGSSAAYHASRAGQRVLLLEQFEIDHGRGSSYGQSRIIRYAYDHPLYVALAKAAYDAWGSLEIDAGESLWVKTGGLDFGVPGAEPMLDGMITSLREMGTPHEILSPAEVLRRFPQFRLDDDMIGLYQADAGVLYASRCVKAHVRLATSNGTHIEPNTQVIAIEPHTDSVTVRTNKGDFSGARLIVAAGAWARQLMQPLGVDLPLRPVKCQENYFQPADGAVDNALKYPVFIAHLPNMEFLPYGLPSVHNSGAKVALHGGPDFDPNTPERLPDESVIETSRQFIARYMPMLSGRLISSRVCLYTMTPDEHFIIDHHPEHANIVISACCSGHGFKFSAVLGRVLVDLALDGRTDHDISLFSLGRFSQ